MYGNVASYRAIPGPLFRFNYFSVLELARFSLRDALPGGGTLAVASQRSLRVGAGQKRPNSWAGALWTSCPTLSPRLGKKVTSDVCGASCPREGRCRQKKDVQCQCIGKKAPVAETGSKGYGDGFGATAGRARDKRTRRERGGRIPVRRRSLFQEPCRATRACSHRGDAQEPPAAGGHDAPRTPATGSEGLCVAPAGFPVGRVWEGATPSQKVFEEARRPSRQTMQGRLPPGLIAKKARPRPSRVSRASGRSARRRLLSVGLGNVLDGFILDRILEALDSLAQVMPQRGEFARSEDEQHDSQNDQPVPNRKSSHARSFS